MKGLIRMRDDGECDTLRHLHMDTCCENMGSSLSKRQHPFESFHGQRAAMDEVSSIRYPAHSQHSPGPALPCHRVSFSVMVPLNSSSLG